MAPQRPHCTLQGPACWTRQPHLAPASSFGHCCVHPVPLWSSCLIWPLPLSQLQCFLLQEVFRDPQVRSSARTGPPQPCLSGSLCLEPICLSQWPRSSRRAGLVCVRPAVSPAPPDTQGVLRECLLSGLNWGSNDRVMEDAPSHPCAGCCENPHLLENTGPERSVPTPRVSQGEGSGAWF